MALVLEGSRWVAPRASERQGKCRCTILGGHPALEESRGVLLRDRGEARRACSART